MFSNGNFLIYFIVFLQCMNFATILSGEPSTDNYSKTNLNSESTNYNRNDNYNNVQVPPEKNVTETGEIQKFSLMAKHRTLEIASKSPSSVRLKELSSSLTKPNENVRDSMELPPTFETLPQPEAFFSGFGTSNNGASLQQRHQLLSPSPSAANEQNSPLPVFPERSDAVYFIVAIIGGAKVWSRELARTLMDMGPPFGSPLGPPLRPLYVDLPPNGKFSVKVLTSLCQQTDGIPLAGIIVIGDGQSARAIAMSGHSMRIPVLWARGGTANIHTTQTGAETDLQTLLQPSAREILEAVRALFLQAHWHSFFVLSDVDATIVLTGTEGSPLKEPPLKPKILPLPVGNSNVFRQLAEISRSTRGIILMLCNLVSARQIMSEAKRLNMAGGHFIWLWADTSSTAEFFDVHKSPDIFEDEVLQYPKAVKHFNGVAANGGIPISSNGDIKPIPKGMGITTTSGSGGVGLGGGASVVVGINGDNVGKAGKVDLTSSSSESSDEDENMFRQFENSVEQKMNMDKSQRQPIINQETSHSVKSNKQRIQPLHNIGNDEKIPSYGNGIINGRYIFGIGPSVDDDGENGNIFLNEKLKRSPSEPMEAFPTVKDDINYDDTEYSEEMNFNSRFDYDIDNKENDNNKNNAANDTESYRKPKRTSTAYFGQNLTTSTHVLFHHFKDFPVGLLALKPVKMPVDSNFVRSTVRLFAATWAQVEIDAAIEEENFRLHNINPYGDNINWLMQSANQRSRGLRERRATTNQKRQRQRNRRNIFDSFEVNKVFNKFHQNYIVNNFELNNNSNNNNNRNNINSNNSSDVRNNNENVHSKLYKNVIYNQNTTKNNYNSDVEMQIGDLKFNRSDINNSSFYNNIKKINKNNQNLSGLITNQKLQSNISQKSNTNEIETSVNNGTEENEEDVESSVSGKLKVKGKSKRSNTLWWTAKDVSNRFRSQSSMAQQRPYGYSGGVGVGGMGGSRTSLGSDNASGIGNDGGSVNSNSSGERYRKVMPYYRGGCFGSASRADTNRAKTFAKALQRSTAQALSGRKLPDGSLARPLIAKFELLNLIPHKNTMTDKLFEDEILVRRRGPRRHDPQMTKWRRVGVITGRNVQLDTIVWPGGDIVVSGLSAKSRTVFRIVTALAPPFVMSSDLDEDGVCLRGLPCHRLLSTAKHNLTLMFNAIETRDRMREDAVEHGIPPPTDNINGYDHSLYETKCCYGLSMDLLDNIATELEFEFHLYIVHDELFGSQFSTLDEFVPLSREREHLRTGGGGKRRQKTLSKTNPSTVGQTTEQYGTTTQRKYHSPEGRTRNFRSASFEREVNTNTQNLNGNRKTAFGNGKQDGKTKRNIRRSSQISVEAYVDDIEEDDDELFSNDWNGGVSHQQPFDDDDGVDGNDGNSERSRYQKPKRQWNGIIGDLIAGSAEMSFAPLTVTRARAEVIDFSVPYFHSGVSLMAAPQSKSEIPLLAFLLPFSPELWIAIFTSLNVTAIAVAIYEWLSPFGLNPWGRQRSKNFSMSSALWVMWGLLCGHLVAFKAPKSWPNKFLINVWGGFSVIFIASYTANIAALIAGLFFHNAANRPEVSLLTQRVGAPTSSATESFMKLHRPHEWEHIKKYTLKSVEDGVRGLKNGSLDLLLGDTPILDYYRAIDHGCNLIRIGETYVEDTYAIGMKKGFPLKDSISALIAKYSSNGYLDILSDKWYGGLPCYKLDTDIIMPRPLGVAAVAGVFLLLGLGIAMGVLILIFEHWFYKYMLPILRHKPKGSVWRSRNIMFFSQKLYRFINCVELVSPHHAARELVTTLRQGQIASLFQKSIKRKEDEQRRRRKSKAQFFEMIQEIRRVQQAERQNKLEAVTEAAELENTTIQIPEIITPHSRSPKPKSSPRPKIFPNRHNRSKSNCSTLNIRRFSTDSILSERLDTIGRRLSRDLTNSPPDFSRRLESVEKVISLSSSNGKFDTFAGKEDTMIQETKFDTYCGNDLLVPMKKHQNRRTPLNADIFQTKKNDELEPNSTKDVFGKSPLSGLSPLPVVKEGLVHPICQEDEAKAVLRDRLHEELITKYGESQYETLPVIRTTSPAVPTIQRTSLRSKERSPMQLKRNRQRSLDGLDARPKMPTPSPTRSRKDGISPDLSSPEPLYSQVSHKSNLQKISLDRLSREDLLKLSESSQTEIHEYLSQSLATDRTKEPP